MDLYRSFIICHSPIHFYFALVSTLESEPLTLEDKEENSVYYFLHNTIVFGFRGFPFVQKIETEARSDNSYDQRFARFASSTWWYAWAVALPFITTA